MQKRTITCMISTLIFAAVFFVNVPADTNAQVTEEWVAVYNGPGNGLDGANDLIIGPNGNIYVTGMSSDISTGYDFDTVCYDPNGNVLWSARYDGKGDWGDEAFSITTDLIGNVYVTGTSHNTDGNYDYITISYNSSGSQQWIARYNGPANWHDRAFAITTDTLGNIYVTGESIGIGTGGDYATIKYDSLGNEVWVARWSSASSGNIERAIAIAVDSLGNVYVTGIGDYGGGIWDCTTIKYNSFGNEQWVARYSFFDAGLEESKAISVDSAGNVFVSCSGGTIAYDSQGNVLWVQTGYEGRDLILDSMGNVYVTGWTRVNDVWGDYFTVVYDSNGQELWNATYNGPENKTDKANAIALDNMGNVFVAGGSDGIGSFQDYTTIAYDSMGNELWIALYNGLGSFHDSISGIAVDPLGNVYVTGTARGLGTDRDWVTIKYSYKVPKPEPTIDIDPDTLNLKSKGRWITCYIDLPGYDVNDIDIGTVILEDTIPAEWGDVQNDTLMVKFDRSKVEDILSPGSYNLKVTGEFMDGTVFEGYSDEIRVIEPP
ncbi:MAG: SBBP repeat-containing protein [Thermoplasmata archaeon]|nr:MAG: SBBP repeat-containing protein [Thermoplasmata archaeon]